MTSTRAFLNHVGTAVPAYDVHRAYTEFAAASLGDPRERRVLERLMSRSQIDHRYGVIPFGYYAGTQPDTATRMRDYEIHAPALVERAIEALQIDRIRSATHLIVTSCTGFYAPGIDIEIVKRFGLNPSIERTLVGFMGCYAALTALKLSRHIVRSDADVRVLIVNVELCSLHLQTPTSIEQAMGYSIFGDGCTASIVSADPVGLSLDAFDSTLIVDSADEITWRIGTLGFDMRLSLDVPNRIAATMAANPSAVLAGRMPTDIDVWAVHPGGRAVLDAVERALGVTSTAFDISRDVLRAFGNMSSATVMFVLERILAGSKPATAQSGCSLAFGPGMMCETMLFTVLP